MGEIGLGHYIGVSAVAFGIGVALIVMRRNAIAVLMGLELVLNAAALNFAAFGRFGGETPERIIEGQVAAIFIIVLAAAEAAVALAIVLNLFHQMASVEVDEADQLKG